MHYCASCYSIGKKYLMSGEKWGSNLYLYSCTNPSHVYSVWKEYRAGRLVTTRVKPPKPSIQQIGDSVYFSDDGKREQKMSKAMYEDITSRAVTKDGEVLRGQRGIEYNQRQKRGS